LKEISFFALMAVARLHLLEHLWQGLACLMESVVRVVVLAGTSCHEAAEKEYERGH